jgi:CheY-like chemotaxis protein
MTISKEIAPHLPYLRRYARALSGAQKRGDAYVIMTLEALVAEPDSFPNQYGARVGLYRVFMRIWSSIALDQRDEEAIEVDEGASVAQRNIASLTPRSRQAFLLGTVEGFGDSDVAFILDVAAGEVERLKAEAGREIAELVATDVLIIEDEAVIAADIELLVQDLGHRVVGVARTHKEAVALAVRERPGLVLADIQLADGSSGLEAVNEILGRFDAPVIFITAYPERLLTGERPEPAFLISKPYKGDSVKATISQALLFGRSATRDRG